MQQRDAPFDPSHGKSELARWQATYAQHGQTDAWRSEFSGKEIVIETWQSFFTRRKNGTSKDDFHVAVARERLRRATLPADIGELHTTLRTRVGL